MTDAPNITRIKKTVLRNTILKDVFLGTWGDPGHQAGSGDHTPTSTHGGKLGYPTQGLIHAIDVGAPNAQLADIERWIRQEIRAGRLTGIKYFNVLHRHWNLQTWTNYNAMKAGRLSPRYSDDNHLHLSMENGSIDGDILDRYIASKDDDMTPQELLNTKIDSAAYGAPKSVADLLKYGYTADVKVQAVQKDVDEIKATLARIEAKLSQGTA